MKSGGLLEELPPSPLGNSMVYLGKDPVTTTWRGPFCYPSISRTLLIDQAIATSAIMAAPTTTIGLPDAVLHGRGAPERGTPRALDYAATTNLIAGSRMGESNRDGFFERVYQMVEQVPQGMVATYGQIAKLIGEPRRARYVGYALHVNPRPGIIPCHRIVFADGRLAAGFAFGGPQAQRDLLETEGVRFLADGRVDLSASRWPAGVE